MAELTIEEKAKAYDEALERMKSWVRGEHPECFDSAKKAAEFIFPSLKESEDERIRKALLEMVHDTTGDSLWVDYNIHKEDAIAYLEKQDTQKSVEPRDNTTFEPFQGLSKDDLDILNAAQKAISFADKNGFFKESTFEDKKNLATEIQFWLGEASRLLCSTMAKWREEEETCFKEIREDYEKRYRNIPTLEMSFKRFFNTLNIIRMQSKSVEWSEEDEENLNWFEKFFRAESVIAEGKDIPQDRYMWFKNLKDRVQSLPKKQCAYNPYKEVVESIAEMCEKYKSPTSDLSDFLDNVKVKCKEAKEYDTTFPQKRWKPTKEQVEAIKSALDPYPTLSPRELHNLKELHKQLKEL